MFAKFKRKIIQTVFALATNAYIPGFLNANIYKGDLKRICVPGLNCYSCPGALGSCPIGALQAVIGSIKYNMSFYVTGLIALFGLALGRAICGFLCPFGLIQELIHKIPFPRIKRPWKRLVYLKYVILAVFVIGMPLLVTNSVGIAKPAFCQYICPAGTLTAGIPLAATSAPLRQILGGLFIWKVSVLAATIVGCMLIYRFFCRYLCPLGAIYALFNKISIYGLTLEKHDCVHCGKCARTCKMNVDPSSAPDSAECIRCGDCVKVCPTKALRSGLRIKAPRPQASAPDAETTT